jgi:hypothetical protein
VRWPDDEFRASSTARRREAFVIAAVLAVALAAGIAVVVIALGPPQSTSAGLYAASGPDLPPDHADFTAAAMPAVAVDVRSVGPGSDRRDSADAVEGASARAAWSDLPANRDVAAPPRARQGPIEVVLLSAAVQRFAPTTGTRTAFGPGAPGRLVLAVRVRNASVSSRLTYRPWSAGGVSPSAQKARLLDDDGRVYPLVESDFGRDAVGAGAGLGPGEAATDVLAFETPPGTFTHLDLELPPGNTGGEGAFALTLRIPASAVSR